MTSPGNSTRTMIVDDEEDIRVLIRAAIAAHNAGLSVACEAADGEAAVATWRVCQPDLVVLDERMPRMGGLEAAARILREKPDQRIVLFSAFLTESIRAAAGELGIRDCLSKEEFDALPGRLCEIAAA